MAGWPEPGRPLRTVRRSHLFNDLASTIESNARRLDEILESVEWAIARDAETYTDTGGGVRGAKTRPFPNAPVLLILFKIVDDSTCELLHIEIVEGPAILE